MHQIKPNPTAVTAVTVLTGANLAATVARFALLRWWVFRTVASQHSDTAPLVGIPAAVLPPATITAA